MEFKLIGTVLKNLTTAKKSPCLPIHSKEKAIGLNPLSQNKLGISRILVLPNLLATEPIEQLEGELKGSWLLVSDKKNRRFAS